MKNLIICFFSVVIIIVAVLFINLMVFQNRAEQISQGTAIKQYNHNKPALLVIDIQEATTGKYGVNNCYTESSDEFLDKINSIIKLASIKDIPVIYIKNETDNFLINILNNSLAKGGAGAKFDSRLDVISNHIISKERNDAFSNPKLDSLLIAKEINKLYVTGLDAAYCVNNTIAAASNRGYSISIIEEALLSESDSLKNVMIANFKLQNADIISLESYTNENPTASVTY